jgi:hypothetical protein
MFIGHFGVGLAAKKVAKKTSLGTLFFASQFIDLLWPLFLIFGIEHVKIDPGNTAFTPFDFVLYPYSHSLIAVLFWSLIFGSIYFLIKKDLKISVWLGVLVLSHWILDFITHRPDLPLFIGSNSPMVGLGIWNSVVATILIEGGIFVLGVYLFIKTTKARNKIGIYSFWSLIIFLILIYIMNLLGPPPESVDAIGYVGLSQWLIILWGYWIGKNRIVES